MATFADRVLEKAWAIDRLTHHIYAAKGDVERAELLRKVRRLAGEVAAAAYAFDPNRDGAGSGEG